MKKQHYEEIKKNDELRKKHCLRYDLGIELYCSFCGEKLTTTTDGKISGGWAGNVAIIINVIPCKNCYKKVEKKQEALRVLLSD